ncbi:MAG: putative hydrolase of the superfamily [Actinomycetota bacterium]|nr:putative hydrolase of the superfamily [Actinomycetota bacterium]
MIQAVLWDFGGVVLTSPFESFARYERSIGLPEGTIRGLNATNPDSNAWAKLERTEVDVATFCTLFEQEALAAGHTLSGQAVIGCLSGDVRPQMVRAQQRIKEAGIRQALLTNNFASGQPEVRAPRADVQAAMTVYDVVIESSKAGVRKPDPAAYQLVLDALALPASSIVFLDDLGINLKPAKALGMTTIKVVDPDTALAELSEILGLDLT